MDPKALGRRATARGRRRTLALLALAAGFVLATSPSGGDTPMRPDQPPLRPLPARSPDVPWPTEAWPSARPGPDVDGAALAAAADALFAPLGRGDVPDTRALLVVRHGRIVFERYAEGFGPESRFHSWSAAKSFTNALTGILVGRGVLALDERAAVPAWQSEDDPRRAITLRHLLNMTSGVDNTDSTSLDGTSGNFVSELLFGRGAEDVNAFAANRPLVHPPGTHWAYSTATSMLVAGIVGRAVADDAAGREAFIRSALLEPLGARNTIFEFDRAGHFLGGSHVFASARDYARLGLLYLRDGVWDGARILPEGWVDFSRTRAPAENNGNHGAHFWINLEPRENQFLLLPGAPSSVFAATGNAGQYVLIVPTHDLVIVRLGEMQSSSWSDLGTGLAGLLEAFPETGG